MRWKTKFKNTFPSLFLLPGLYLFPQGSGRWEWGLWSAHHMLFLLLLRKRSPSPATVWGPSHIVCGVLPTLFVEFVPHCLWRHSFTNFSNVIPSHGLQFLIVLMWIPFYRVQSFKNRLLHFVFSKVVQALPRNLIQYGLLSPWVCRSLQDSAPAQASSGFHLLWHGSLL